jgi:hypothetical protein
VRQQLFHSDRGSAGKAEKEVHRNERVFADEKRSGLEEEGGGDEGGG